MECGRVGGISRVRRCELEDGVKSFVTQGEDLVGTGKLSALSRTMTY